MDVKGRFIVGFGHHILSGGHPVGAAGQIYVDENSIIQEINLNFSGHYRPPLSAEYVRYTYRSIVNHPLMCVSPSASISGRKFFDLGRPMTKVSFSAADLLSEESTLHNLIEDIIIFDENEEEEKEWFEFGS